MEFYRRHWYEIGGALFVLLAYYMGFWGDRFSPVQVILIYSFMAMLVHQFEEYALPGGLPAIGNIVMSGERDAPDRYPLNANQVMISNVLLTYPFYVIPVFLPGIIWLGLMQVGQGLLQVIAHGAVANVKLKRPYNPGMASNLLLQLPIGIYYIWYVRAHHLATTSDFLVGSIAAVLSLFVLWFGPIAIFRSRQSKYPFTAAQMYGYAEAKVKAMLRG